jgi:MoxR-like ATPase
MTINASIEPLRKNLQDVIYGNTECINVLCVAVLAGGSVLIEDVPGVGKTTLARALSKSIDAGFNRIQFTPDLLPADILGSSIYNPVSGQFTFRPGPIFCNILLADEINRASPRTQSALLEAMNEHQVTVEGRCSPLPQPFWVLATQNPIEFHGTYPLPEAQLDRFLVQMTIGYPSTDVEIEIIRSHSRGQPIERTEPVLSLQRILKMQQEVLDVHMDAGLLEYVAKISDATRKDSRLRLGVSPRGTLMLARAARAGAYFHGRTFVTPDDVQWLIPYVHPHRVVLTSKSRSAGLSKAQVIADVVSRIKVPV